MFRALLSVCVLLLVFGAAFAQTDNPAVKATDYAAQLQALENETASQIRALEDQRVSVDSKNAELVEQRIVEIKTLYEVQRLQILLAQAESEGNDARALEIRNALQNWLNPPAVPTTQVQRPAPDAPGTTPQSRDNNH